MKILKYLKNAFLSLILILFTAPILASDTITFPSKDGLIITADTYFSDNKKRPLIVLFHQAGWSRGEYIETAPKLNELGFNTIAVDLRSGNKINGVQNQTAKLARKAGKGVTYLDALQDIESALRYARTLVDKDTKIIAWGSSYSAALVLQIAGEKTELVDAVISFSPGEYFKKLGKPADWIAQSARFIRAPVFISSAKLEKRRWQAIFDVIKTKKQSFVPKDTKGYHGSRALWEKFNDSAAYWTALRQFLKNIE